MQNFELYTMRGNFFTSTFGDSETAMASFDAWNEWRDQGGMESIPEFDAFHSSPELFQDVDEAYAWMLLSTYPEVPIDQLADSGRLHRIDALIAWRHQGSDSHSS